MGCIKAMLSLIVLTAVGGICFTQTYSLVQHMIQEADEFRIKVIRVEYSPKYPYPPQEIVDRSVGIENDGFLCGAGIMVEPGKVLTAAHVVEDEGRYMVRIERKNGKLITSECRVEKVDLKHDLALLSCAPIGPCPKSFIRIAGTGIRLNTPVVAVGSPLGLGEKIVSSVGFLSCKYSLTTEDNQFRYTWLASTPSTFGNSGGGVFDANTGVLVGMLIGVTAKSTTAKFVPPDIIADFLKEAPKKASVVQAPKDETLEELLEIEP